jgi:aldose 1-epimerase
MVKAKPAGPLRLSDGIAEAVVRPDLGGGLASYDRIAVGTRRALFRRAGAAPADAFALACNPLVPWSNRISGGGFRADGHFVALAANWPGEPLPLHGNGFQARWDVAPGDGHAAELALHSDGPGAFRSTARLRYGLQDGAPGMRLTVRHHGEAPLPVYILRSPGTQADFFCFEPVSHPVDAHDLPGLPGPFRLAPGESASVQCRFIPREP